MPLFNMICTWLVTLYVDIIFREKKIYFKVERVSERIGYTGTYLADCFPLSCSLI